MLPLFYSQTNFETSVETTDVEKSKIEYTGFIARLHVTNRINLIGILFGNKKCNSVLIIPRIGRRSCFDGSPAKSTKKEGDILVDKGGKRQEYGKIVCLPYSFYQR